MHDAKVEAYIPLGPGPDAIEVIADTDGCQLNIMIDGVCEFRLNIDKFLELKLVEHGSIGGYPKQDITLYEANLEKLFDQQSSF